MNNEKRNNIIKLILRVFGLFILFELIVNIFSGVFSRGLLNTIYNGKYTIYFISELVVVIFTLILLGLKKRFNIFKEHKMNFKDSVKLCIPIVVISIFMFLANTMEIISESMNWANLLSLILYCALIGLFEEIFFRGILQRELTDNYGNSKKQVIISLCISAFIFAFVHLSNLLYGQDLLTTVMQVIQTFAIGILLGSVYYISNNIWSVIFLHGFYDFTVMLSDVNLIKDCTYLSNVPIHVTIQSLVVSLLLSSIYLIFSFKLLNRVFNKKETEEDIKKENIKEKIMNSLMWFLLCCIFTFNIIFSICIDDNLDEYYKCFNYENIEVEKIETHYYSYDNFVIKDDNGEEKYNVYMSDNKAYIKEYNTDMIIDLGIDYCDRLIVFDNHLMIIGIENNDYKIYYSDIVDSLDNVRSSFKEYDVPDVAGVGYLIDVDNNIKYPMIKSITNDVFVINEDSVYLVD